MSKLVIEVAVQIQKLVAEMFDAAVILAKMSGYFIESGSAHMESEAKIVWKFPDSSNRLWVWPHRHASSLRAFQR